MRSHLATLVLVLLVGIIKNGASGTSVHASIARPKVTFSTQDSSAHLDDIHHLECQLSISRQHDTLNTLRCKAQSIAGTFGKDLYLLNKNTLKACTQIYKDMVESEARGYRAKLGDWAPYIFNSPVERFVSDGAVFLNGLKPLRHDALELASLSQHNISECASMLVGFCQGESQPCVGNDAFVSRTRSSLELKACDQIEPLKHLEQAARAWSEVAYDIEEIRKVFSSTWGLVKDSQVQEQKASEEWVANVVAKWIAMLEDLVVRTRKHKGDGEVPAGTPTTTEASITLPLFYEPLRQGVWRL
ncbi:hypothetical protein M436DRAFT_60399 [Aureobasidium namibiae CBS 147.97]|uniref:Karyogamy protein 5 n=1 Tax=Aureobasidium namibiae CBS 147.97 TaxID=1043004 RepID=A0A074XPQ3_9PEZI